MSFSYYPGSVHCPVCGGKDFVADNSGSTTVFRCKEDGAVMVE